MGHWLGHRGNGALNGLFSRGRLPKGPPQFHTASLTVPSPPVSVSSAQKRRYAASSHRQVSLHPSPPLRRNSVAPRSSLCSLSPDFKVHNSSCMYFSFSQRTISRRVSCWLVSCYMLEDQHRQELLALRGRTSSSAYNWLISYWCLEISELLKSHSNWKTENELELRFLWVCVDS